MARIGLAGKPKTPDRRPFDAQEVLNAHGLLDDHTPRDWYNRWIGQRPSMTPTWRCEYWPGYFDGGPPEYGEPWEVVPPGLDHVIPPRLRLDAC